MDGQHADHNRHVGHSVAMFREKFWWTLIFTIPVVVWSADVQHWLGSVHRFSRIKMDSSDARNCCIRVWRNRFSPWCA